MATSTASSTSTFGAPPQVPGSFQLVPRISSMSALTLIFSAIALPLLLRCCRGGLGRRLGGRLRLLQHDALLRQVQIELGDAAAADDRRLDLDQLRVAEPGR